MAVCRVYNFHLLSMLLPYPIPELFSISLTYASNRYSNTQVF